MARIPALRNGNSETDHLEPSVESLSAALANAHSTEERREIFATYLSEHEGEFDADSARVAKYLKRNDLDGLIKHGSRHVPDEAAARVASIRAGKR